MSAEDERTLISKARLDGPRPAGRTAMLELVAGPGAPRAFPLAQPMIVVGRDAAADVQVDSPEVSRRHLRLMRVGDEHMCVDQDSAGGVFVNGTRLRSAVLREGDRIELGGVTFIYRSA